MVAVAASVDLYTKHPQRVDLGLVMPDNSLVSFGTVDVAFSLVGDAAHPGPTATATFVPTFGTPERSDGPVVTQPNEGRGVYEASDVVFDTPGVWVADVTADVKGLGPQTAQASFAVQEQPSLPAPGDRAQPTENLTVDSKGVPLAAIDSRAASTGTIPDPELTSGRSLGRSRGGGRRSWCSRRPCSASAGSAARSPRWSRISLAGTPTGPCSSTSRSGRTTTSRS
jgi:hypothetical protein